MILDPRPRNSKAPPTSSSELTKYALNAGSGIPKLVPSNDGLKWFNRLYLMVTQRIDAQPPPKWETGIESHSKRSFMYLACGRWHLTRLPGFAAPARRRDGPLRPTARPNWAYTSLQRVADHANFRVCPRLRLHNRTERDGWSRARRNGLRESSAGHFPSSADAGVRSRC